MSAIAPVLVALAVGILTGIVAALLLEVTPWGAHTDAEDIIGATVTMLVLAARFWGDRFLRTFFLWAAALGAVSAVVSLALPGFPLDGALDTLLGLGLVVVLVILARDSARREGAQ